MLTHPVNFLVGGTRRKSTTFGRVFDQLFPHVIKCPNTGFELLTSEVGGSRSDDQATEAPTELFLKRFLTVSYESFTKVSYRIIGK